MNLATRYILDSTFAGTTTANATGRGRATATTGAHDVASIGTANQLIDKAGSVASVTAANKLQVGFTGNFDAVYLSELFSVSNQVVEATTAANDNAAPPNLMLRYTPRVGGISCCFGGYGGFASMAAFVAGNYYKVAEPGAYVYDPTHAHVFTASIVQIGWVAVLTMTDLDTTSGTTQTYSYTFTQGNRPDDSPVDLAVQNARGSMGLGTFSLAGSGNCKFTRLRLAEWVNLDRLICCVGDSRTAGFGVGTDVNPVNSTGGPTGTYPSQLKTLLGAGFDVVNLGRSGWGMGPLTTGSAGMLAMAPGDLIFPYDYSRLASNSPTAKHLKPVAALWSGVNSESDGVTVADAFSQLLAYAVAARRAGYYVIACTEIERDNSTTWTAWKTSYNALILANADKFDGVARLDQTSLGTSSVLHPNSTGLGLVAAAVKTQVDAIVAAETTSAATYTAASNVRSGTDRGDGTLGTLAVPAASTVLAGTTYDATTAGTVVLPTAGTVKVGTAYGAASGTTGTYDGSDRWSVVAASDLRAGVGIKANSATVNVTGSLVASGGGATIEEIADLLAEGVVLAPTGLDAIPTTPPTPGASPNFGQMVVMTWRRWFKKATVSGTTLTCYADDGTTAITTQSVPLQGTAQTQGAASVNAFGITLWPPFDLATPIDWSDPDSDPGGADERDVMLDVVARLTATEAFDHVSVQEPGDPEPAPGDWHNYAIAWAASTEETDLSMSGPRHESIRRGTYGVAIEASAADSVDRQAELSRLAALAMRALSHVSLAGATFPATTTIKRDARRDGSVPVGRVTLTGQYEFLAVSDDYATAYE